MMLNNQYKCPRCGSTNTADRCTCRNCGLNLNSVTECKKCGRKKIPIYAIFCPQCGEQISYDKKMIESVKEDISKRLNDASSNVDAGSESRLYEDISKLMSW